MGEVVPARTSPTLPPPSPPTVYQLSRLALKELTVRLAIVMDRIEIIPLPLCFISLLCFDVHTLNRLKFPITYNK